MLPGKNGITIASRFPSGLENVDWLWGGLWEIIITKACESIAVGISQQDTALPWAKMHSGLHCMAISCLG